MGLHGLLLPLRGAPINKSPYGLRVWVNRGCCGLRAVSVPMGHTVCVQFVRMSVHIAVAVLPAELPL